MVSLALAHKEWFQSSALPSYSTSERMSTRSHRVINTNVPWDMLLVMWVATREESSLLVSV